MKLAQGSDKTERKKNSRGGQGPTIDEEKNQIEIEEFMSDLSIARPAISLRQEESHDRHAVVATV